MNKQNEIIRITDEFLKNTVDYQKLRAAAKEYKETLLQFCDCNLDNETGKNDIQLTSGKALGTYWAALCIDDFYRTRQFIRGIDQAIREKLQKKDSLHILYAGSGPFATLLLPFILRYPKEKIKYTLLEINPYSLEILKNLIAQLNLQNHTIDIIQDDATQYKFRDESPDIIVSETMQNALAKEQQVPIFINLMQQAKPSTVFIPERITLSIGLKKENHLVQTPVNELYKKAETVFELSKEALIYALQTKETLPEEITFPRIQTKLEKEKLYGYNQLVLLTEIEVFKCEKIGLNDSGLTTPVIIDNIPDNLNKSITIYSQYTISTEPKLEYKIVAD